MELWTGTFKSNTYPFIYGKIEVYMFPPDVVGYTTQVKVKFKGFAALVQGIFSPKMEFDIKVESNKKLTMKVGKADIVFNTVTGIKKDTKEIKGEYVAKAGSYVSLGELTLRKGNHD